VRNFLIGQAFLFVLGGIIDAVAERSYEERCQVAPPSSTAIVSELNRAGEIDPHG